MPRARKLSDSFSRLKRLRHSKRSDSMISMSSSEFIGVSELHGNDIPVISKKSYLKRLYENNEESMQLLSEKISEKLEQSPSIERLEKTDNLVHRQMKQMQNKRNSLLSREEFIGY